MNYTQYLQGGDSIQTPMSDEQALAMQKQKDAQAAEAIKSNPSILDKAIQNYGEDAPAFIKHMIDVAAENQDEQLLEILKPYAEKFNISAFRCGGKVRAKVKKAKCGKKMEKGGEALIKKEAKGGKPCPCTLHKVGGKLIEVDCNGIPVAKNGAVLYAKPGNELPPATASEEVKNYMTVKPISKAMPFSDQWFGDLGKAFVNKIWGTPTPVKKEVTSNEPVVGSPEWIAQQRKNQEAYYQTPEGQAAQQRADQVIAAQRQAETEAARRAQEEAARAAAIRERNAFGAGKQGKFGGLTYDEALVRQNEMLAAKDQGFNVDLGRWGADGKWGNQSRSEWERYQQWKTAQSAQPQMSAGERFVTERYNSVRPWQDAELQNMDADQAIHLKAPDYNRWISLHFNQAQSKPYVAPTTPVLNQNAFRKDVYNFSTARAPFTQINPIVAIRKDGGKFISYKDYLKL